MTFSLRPARVEDIPAIVPWTAATFEWGDYVPDSLPGWIEDEGSQVLLCVDEADAPVALAHVLMLSPSEGWLEAARVHPDHQRSGMGSALNRAGVAWAQERGARVVRLATEEENAAARRQVEALGYRTTSTWAHARLSFDPATDGFEGGRLRPAPAPDVDAAWMFWSTTDLYHRGRGLIALGWRWRKARPEDLAGAAADGRLLQSPAGWVMADPAVDGGLWVGWLATTPAEAPLLIDGLARLGTERGVGVSTMVPDLPWAGEALTRAGATPSRILVYSLAV